MIALLAIALTKPSNAWLSYSHHRVLQLVANTARAEAESSQATASVVAMLDSDLFRSLWSVRCPSLADLPSTEILERYHAELEVTEVVHGFPAGNNPNQDNALDMSIDIML